VRVQPAGTCEAAPEMLFLEARHANMAAALRGVHEAAVACVDADVAHAAALEPEEYEIARPQVVALHRRGGGELLRGGARHGNADLAVRVAYEPAAVEGVGTRTTVTIRCADA
jgi:hypothetical protein